MAETTKKATEKKEELVKIKIPRDGNKGDVFVSVNERTWLIKRNVEVEVPACVAEVLANAEAMEAEAYDFDESVKK